MSGIGINLLMEAVMGKNKSFCILFLLTALWLPVGGSHEATAAGYEQEFTSGGITFHVEGVNEGAAGRVKITLSGSGVDPGPVECSVDGTVTWAELTDDLDNDGSPELYVYATCPEEVANHVNHDPYSSPSVTAVATIGPHGKNTGNAAVVVAPVMRSSSVVVVGSVVGNGSDNGIVRVFPVIPVESAEHQGCIRELKFVLVSTKKGKALKLKSKKIREQG